MSTLHAETNRHPVLKLACIQFGVDPIEIRIMDHQSRSEFPGEVKIQDDKFVMTDGKYRISHLDRRDTRKFARLAADRDVDVVVFSPDEGVLSRFEWDTSCLDDFFQEWDSRLLRVADRVRA